LIEGAVWACEPLPLPLPFPSAIVKKVSCGCG
jgi:hypothetical protein